MLLLSLAIAVACTSKGDGGTGPVNNPAIALSLSPSSASVAQGSSTTTTGTISRSGGFSGDVLLTETGAPAGVTASVGNISTSGGVTTATITIQVGAAVATGSYTITVTGAGSGVTAATTTFTLTVTQGGSYTMVAAPAAVSLAPGGSAPVTLTFVSTNLTGGVALTLEGAPAGVTGAFNPASPATGPTTTLTISVGAAVVPGTYALTVRGKVAGLTDVTAAISLTVLAQSYTMALAPTTLSIAQGGSATSTVTLNRTNFIDGVALTLEAPAGVTGITGSFNPTPAAAAAAGAAARSSAIAYAVTATTSTLTVTVASTVATGVYSLTVRGKNAALADVTATLSLTVVGGVIANGKIVFKAGLDAIWTVNPDGTALTQLTPGYGAATCQSGDEEPRYSPDGTKILFSRTKDGSTEIWVMNADGTNQTKLTNDGDGNLCTNGKAWDENASWSPDGKKTLFTSARASDNFVEALWTMNADGTGQTLLLAMATSLVSEGYYSPDGKTIAFHVEPLAPTAAASCDGVVGGTLGGEIWIMSADGTNPRRLTTHAGCNWDENLAWSPDGKKIAFTREVQNAEEEIFIMNADGTSQIQLTSNFAGTGSERPSFSPDGTKIVFGSHVNNDSIWYMNVDGTSKVPVNVGVLQDNGQPNWQPIFRPAARR